MPHTRPHKRRRHRGLRREAPSVVPVLAEPAHLARMRRYRSFRPGARTAHGGGTAPRGGPGNQSAYRAYLHDLEAVLRGLAAEGVPARLALFDPVDFELFCRRQRLEPDSPASRSRFTAEVATAGATLPYDGERLDRLIPRLVDARGWQRTWEAAADVLSGIGRCPSCGTDIGRAAFDRATRALTALLEGAGGGTHHMVCSVAVPGVPLTTGLAAHRPAGGGSRLAEPAALALTAALAAGFATGSPGGIVLRTYGPGEAGDTVRGWRLDADTAWLRALTAAEVFTAYCTDPATGEPLAPEPGVEHAPGVDLPAPEGGLHC